MFRICSLVATVLLVMSAAPDITWAQFKKYKKGDRVEVDGYWRDGYLLATAIETEQPDPNSEIKGFFASIDFDKNTIFIPPFTILLGDDPDIEDSDSGDSYDLDELEKDWRLSVEGELVGPNQFRAVEIDVDRKRDDTETLELEGFVEAVRTEGNIQIITILGIEVHNTTQTTHDIQSVGMSKYVDQDEGATGLLFQTYLNKDQTIKLTVTGEVQFDPEIQDTFNLDNNNHEDQFTIGTSTSFNALLTLNPTTLIYSQLRSAKDYVVYDQDRDRRFNEQSRVNEIYLAKEKFLDYPLSFRIGRQRIDDEKEWFYDENFDAFRVQWEPGNWLFDYSVGSFLIEAPRPEYRDLMTQILLVEYEWDRDCFVGGSIIDIQEDNAADRSPFYLNAHFRGEPSKAIKYWGHYSYLDGVDGFQRLEAHAVDGGAAYQFRNLPLRPYVFGGYAWGSGDGRAGGRTNRQYRQTGYEDNNDKVFGVAAYRYYGELLQPELSNLHVYSIGMGVRPAIDLGGWAPRSRWLSVDVVYHYYMQDKASSSIRDSDLRISPSGLDKELGSEIDVIIGADKLVNHMDLELGMGYFFPGDAFPSADAAQWIRLQIEWNF